MPIRIFHRVWCKSCNQFQLHSGSPKDTLTCQECKTVYTDIFLKDVPEDKLLEQRKRWKKSQSNFVSEFMKGAFQTPEQRMMEDVVDMFSEPGHDIEIVESDCGMKAIEKKERIEREKRWEKRKIEIEKEKVELLKYKNLERNDICICGKNIKNIKYKKCCLNRIRGLESKHF